MAIIRSHATVLGVFPSGGACRNILAEWAIALAMMLGRGALLAYRKLLYFPSIVKNIFAILCGRPRASIVLEVSEPVAALTTENSLVTLR